MIIKFIIIIIMPLDILGILYFLIKIFQSLKIDQFERMYFLIRKVQRQIDQQASEKRKGMVIVNNEDIMITFANRKRAREYVIFLGEKALRMVKNYPHLASIERISIMEMEIQELVDRNRSAKWMD